MTFVGVLGPLVIERVGVSSIVLPSASQRRLVCALAMHPGTLVRSSALEDSLQLSSGALRTTVSRVRRLLGGDTLTSAPGGYALCAEVDAVDFEHRVRRGLAGGDSTRADLEEAIALWRGDPYQEFADEPWAQVEVRRLRELHAAAVEAYCSLLLDAGEHTRVIADLEALIAAHPYRDRPRALLMQSLAAAGRRTEALREFQAYRTVLLDDIGTEPGPDLVALDRAIARAATTTVVHHDLPSEVSSFVGRAREIAEVRELIRDHRLVTLTGPGGSGKTRLALHVVSDVIDDQFDDIWWVDLSLVGDVSEVAEHVARALGAGPGTIDGLLARLGSDRTTLVVLDNAEHVVGPVADLVARLLSACPNLVVVTTSRHVLGVDGEEVWRVPPLSSPAAGVPLTFETLHAFDAVALFLERVRSSRRGLVVDREVLSQIASICDAVEGMPLALELAAAQVRTSPISDVARRITEVTSWSTSRPGSQSAKHRTLRASIEWSVDLLCNSDRRLLNELAVFRSPFTREAALTVAGSGEAAELAAGLDRLVDASLLQLDDDSERYRMLETVKQFCAAAGLTDDEVHELRGVHARYYAAWCTAVGDGLRGIEEQRISLEMPDVVEALTWARSHEPSLALQICVGLASLWTALARTAATTATWDWLMSFERGDSSRSADWAAAVAALMSWATGQRVTFEDGLADEVTSALPPDAFRAHGWMERGAAMVPAYGGRMGPIVDYTAAVAARGDDLELSIYGGFSAYMLALAGRVAEADHWLHQLRRLTRRQRTSFAVETIGNGYAAAIVVDALKGDLASASERAACAVPTGSLFAVTAAAALAQVALWTEDQETMHRAVQWSDRPMVPLLAYTTAMVGCAASMLEGEVDRAADLAEDFVDFAPRVPVGFAQGWPICQRALLTAGRTTIACRATDEVAALVARMEAAPYAHAALHLARAQQAVQRGDGDSIDRHGRELLSIATEHGFALHVVDALELIAYAACGRDGATTPVSSTTAARRDDLGYRYNPLHGLTSEP